MASWMDNQLFWFARMRFAKAVGYWFYCTPEQAALFHDEPERFEIRLASRNEIRAELELAGWTEPGTMPAVTQ
jgi:hypothetical protein